MTATYLDSSAFVKTLRREAESTALRRYLQRAPRRWVSSALLRAEIFRVVWPLGPELIARARESLATIDLVPVENRILDSAGILEPRTLRTLDAIHLATALEVGEELTSVVTYDRRMIEAASLIGLATASPA